MNEISTTVYDSNIETLAHCVKEALHLSVGPLIEDRICDEIYNQVMLSKDWLTSKDMTKIWSIISKPDYQK